MNLTKDFHVSQVALVLITQRYSHYGSLSSSFIAFLLFLSIPFQSNDFAKGFIFISQLAATANCFKLSRLNQSLSSENHLSVIDRANEGLSNHLAVSYAPPKRDVVVMESAKPLAPLVKDDIKKALSKPHIMLLGETGSGKSTLVKYLVSQSSAPAIVLDVHAAPDDWQGMTVIGAGRNYKAVGDEVNRLVQLMNDRYELRGKGKTTFEPLLVILDEFPACVANLGKKFTESIMLLVREARKVGIKLIILAQGSEVKTLGIEGQGAIRECFAMVTLGKFAINAAKSLKDEQIIEFINNAQYPAMLDDLPCDLPSIGNLKLNLLPMPSDYNPTQLSLQPESITDNPDFDFLQDREPIFLKIVDFLDGREWERDNYIRESITDLKRNKTPISEVQGYLQYLEVQGYVETRNAGRNGIEARKI